MQAVQNGRADFGVCTTGILLEKPTTPQTTVLGVIYQHSPAIILVPSRAGIGALSELKGHRLMDTPGNDDLVAMLKHSGVDYAALPRVQHNGDPREPPMTLGNVRELGVQNLIAFCLNDACARYHG